VRERRMAGIPWIRSVHASLSGALVHERRPEHLAWCLVKAIGVTVMAIWMSGCATAALLDWHSHRSLGTSRSFKSKSITVMKNDGGYYLVVDSGQWGWRKRYLVPRTDPAVERDLQGLVCATNQPEMDSSRMEASMSWGTFSLAGPNGASQWMETRTKPAGGEPVLVLTDVPTSCEYVSGAKVFAFRCEQAVLLPLAIAVDIVALPIEIAGITYFILTWDFRGDK